jgi:hypothetical protein
LGNLSLSLSVLWISESRRRIMRLPPTLAAAIALASVPISLDGQADEEWSTDFSRHTVPLEEIVSGGPPKDGIPAIDEPRFLSVDEADRFLEDREPVVLLEISGAVRAYPLQILLWHEIINDAVNGTPVAVTYCPLCNTAQRSGVDGFKPRARVKVGARTPMT